MEGSLTHKHEHYHHPLKLVGIQQWEVLVLTSWTEFNGEEWWRITSNSRVLLRAWSCTRTPLFAYDLEASIDISVERRQS